MRQLACYRSRKKPTGPLGSDLVATEGIAAEQRPTAIKVLLETGEGEQRGEECGEECGAKYTVVRRA